MPEHNHPDFLIIGATGLIGATIAKTIPEKYSRQGTCLRQRPSQLYQLDIRDKNAVAKLVGELRPRYVILSSNLSGGVHYAEKHPAEARELHFKGTLHVAETCRELDTKLIFISSECVFDGKKEVYTETDSLSPLSVYGQCKADCETWIARHLDNFVITRTMSVFGWQPETNAPNAVMSAYFALRDKKEITVPSYRWGTPTYVWDLAEAIVELCLKDSRGIYHITGSTYINRHEWIKKSCEKLGWGSNFIKNDPVPPKESIYPLKVHLDNHKFRSQFAAGLHPLNESLNLLKSEISSKPGNLFIHPMA
jgi:dTDP-4-dehydrorhamnose reductase